ncbi:MAG: MMPL family transporter [Pseudomonas sp.]
MNSTYINPEQERMPACADVNEFNRRSGSVPECILFNHRALFLLLFALITVFLGYQATQLRMNASFEKVLPQSHEYIQNYLENQDALRGLGNGIRINVQHLNGDIYDKEYLQALQDISDTAFLLPGVDRSFMKSLWTPAVRWTEVTEQGFKGGPVMPNRFDGSRDAMEQLRQNVQRAGLVGSLVSNDLRSSMIVVPLLDRDPTTGEALDYAELSRELEQKIRSKQSADLAIHIVGFAKVTGDLIDGIQQMMAYFLVATILAAVVMYSYSRCLRSTLLVLGCSLLGVIWQLGLVNLMGFGLDPYSILVPFLVFAIGISHGTQIMNGTMQQIGRGCHRYVAARYSFRKLAGTGLIALITDMFGFAVLLVIDIPVIRDLGLTASIGVFVLIITNLVLLTVMLSYLGVGGKAAARAVAAETSQAQPAWQKYFVRFTERRHAVALLSVMALLTLAGLHIRQDLKVGDLDAGAPELRPDSRYNLDNAFITENYGLSSDQFVVIVKTATEGIGRHQTMIEMDRLEQEMRKLPSVQTTVSPAHHMRFVTAASYEGSPKWLSVNREQSVLSASLNLVAAYNPELINKDWSVAAVVVYLKDHKAETLQQVVEVAERFAIEHSNGDHQFLLAAGSAGVEAATNITVEKANSAMMWLVYAVVITLCLISFRSWRATLVAVLPLVFTSILCEALMVWIGIGVKVATLPVLALGVGVGVDYALYLLGAQLAAQRRGASLAQAYGQALTSTGRVVALIGVTLAVGVVTWAFSPIKFQADMGILLTFMFLWNMIGALILIPALSHFLLPSGSGAVAVNVGMRAHSLTHPAPDADACLQTTQSNKVPESV